MLKARHIGYYNDPDDIRELVMLYYDRLFDDGKFAEDGIVSYFMYGLGNFHKAEYADTDITLDKSGTAYTDQNGNRHPVVAADSGNYIAIPRVDTKHLDSEDNFIDIYKVLAG